MGGLPEIYRKAKESVYQVVLSGMFTRKRIREGLGRDPVSSPTSGPRWPEPLTSCEVSVGGEPLSASQNKESMVKLVLA